MRVALPHMSALPQGYAGINNSYGAYQSQAMQKDSVCFGSARQYPLEALKGTLASSADKDMLASVLAEAFTSRASRAAQKTDPMLARYQPLFRVQLEDVEALTVARHKGQIIGGGFLKVEPGCPDALKLDAIGILPRHKGHQVGDTILKSLSETAQELGYRRIILYPLDNPRLIKYYEEQGYQFIPEGEYPKPGYMQKILSEG